MWEWGGCRGVLLSSILLERLSEYGRGRLWRGLTILYTLIKIEYGSKEAVIGLGILSPPLRWSEYGSRWP